MNLTIENLDIRCLCTHELIGDMHSFINDMSFNFSTGVYAIVSEPDLVGWALSSYITGHYKSLNQYNASNVSIKIDDKEMKYHQLLETSCCIGSRYATMKKQNRGKVIDLINKAQKSNRSACSMEEIKEKFQLGEKLYKPLEEMGNFIWNATAGLGWAKGRRIFCYPWLSNYRLKSIENRIGNVSHTLSEMGGIVILPVSSSQQAVALNINRNNILCVRVGDNGKYFLDVE